MSVRDSWATPDWLFRYIKDRYPDMDVDICASHLNHKLPVYLSENNSCLTQPWPTLTGTVFCNPPYSNPLPFIQAAVERKDQIDTVFLLNLDTSTQWFKKAIQNAKDVVFFVGGRIQFDPPDGITPSSNSKPSFLIVIGRGVLTTHYEDIRQIQERYENQRIST